MKNFKRDTVIRLSSELLDIYDKRDAISRNDADGMFEAIIMRAFSAGYNSYSLTIGNVKK
jgi:hypothetical protein